MENAFVSELFKICKPELSRLCNASMDYLRGLYDSDEILHEDFTERSEKLMLIQDHLKKDGTTDTVIKTSRELVKNCNQISNKQSTITNDTQELTE